ncbi:protein FAR1-RELATED SEQUENCE 5-like [Macadamia integrifolia]|uniref:protein FAR1-RELATED SEQUENCE 5-like n=1 Tax=Macadamia integrifolia TaxID=60698 RepID=UPI001C4F72DB|nr:protein FAR1-RELATED SEQUENCE 5-like [Macadamia integrifolia]
MEAEVIRDALLLACNLRLCKIVDHSDYQSMIHNVNSSRIILRLSYCMENACLNDAKEPWVGMLFNSEQEAYDFYNSYGWAMGFSIRRHTVNKSKKDKMTSTSRQFVCSKAGSRQPDKRDNNITNPQAKIRTSCKAQMAICLGGDGKYMYREFVEEHNYDLHTDSTVHMMRS